VRKKILRCSFCDKSARQVKKLVQGRKATICNECVNLCNDILAEEATDVLDGRKAWDWPTVLTEFNKFSTRNRLRVGLTETTVRSRLGEPDRVTDGTSVHNRTGKLKWKADRNLVYSSVLPHTTVWFSIFEEKVKSIAYAPKWKRRRDEG
jgi:ClpX C4-type zinc finger protein